MHGPADQRLGVSMVLLTWPEFRIGLLLRQGLTRMISQQINAHLQDTHRKLGMIPHHNARLQV